MPTTAQPTLEIKELDGQRRTVELNGRCAPQKLKLGGKQRHEITWNAGSPDATLQVFGAEESPVDLNGMWRDRHILGDNPTGVARLNGRQIASAQDLAFLFDEIRIQGQRLRFSWGPYVRYGILDEFHAEPSPTLHDISWEAHLVFDSRKSDPSPMATASVASVGGLAANTNSALQKLKDLVNNPPVEIANGDALARIRDQVDSIENSYNGVKDTLTGYGQQILSASQSVRRTLGFAGNLVKDAREMVSGTQDAVYRELLGYEDVAQASAGEGIAAAEWARQIGDNGGEIRDKAVEFRDESQSKLQADVINTHTVRETEDLRIISEIYYSTRDEWRRIAIFNGLQSPFVATGTKVLIPRFNGSSETL